MRPIAATILLIGCGSPAEPKALPALVVDASTPEAPVVVASSCEMAFVLPELPPVAPQSQCVPRAKLLAMPAGALTAELADLSAASADSFKRKRDKLVNRGKPALKRLRELSTGAPTASERALAAALVTRIEKPAEVKRLDDWAPSKHALMLRNPAFKVAAELAAAYAPFPELAFEALTRARGGAEVSPPHTSFAPASRSPLFEVVLSGPEGYDRLADLVAAFPQAFTLLVKGDAKRGTCAALDWLAGKLPDETDERGRGVLTALDSDDPLALYLLRRALRDWSPRNKEGAAAALARRKDQSAVADLLATVGDHAVGQNVRIHLSAILGAEETEKRLALLARDCRSERRVGAARALRWSAAVPGSETLAILAGDADTSVRAAALESLAWLSLTHRDARVPFSDAVERSVIAATGDADVNVRRLALGALWRLVVEKRRPANDAMRSVWARALSDPDRRARNISLVELDDFFPGDSDLILVLLGDLGRVPDEWPHKEALEVARRIYRVPSRARVSEFARGPVPELRAIAEAWLARK
jgi:hypothetical protein